MKRNKLPKRNGGERALKVKPEHERRSISEKEAQDALAEGAKKITPADVEKVLSKAEEIENKFETGGPLGRFFNEFKLLLSVVQDYWTGKYRKIPYWSIAAIVFALLYVLNPFDIIPDFLPVVGYIDDALVVAACLALVRQDLHKYKRWKEENPH